MEKVPFPLGVASDMHWKRPLSFSMERQLVDDCLQTHESTSRRTAVSEVGIRNLATSYLPLEVRVSHLLPEASNHSTARGN